LNASKLERRTIADFGEQWNRYPGNAGHYAGDDMLVDYCGPLLNPAELRGLTVADVGSGSGRTAVMLAKRGATVTALEPSDAFAVLQRNTADLGIRCLRLRGEDIPTDGFDLVTSFGVIHHIPDPAPTMRAMFSALRPGGRALIWVYGREGNRLYLSIFGSLRAITTRLPHSAIAGLCRALGAVATGYGTLATRLPLPLARYFNQVYMPLTPGVRRLVIYDQLNPAHAKYYRRAEVEQLMRNAGFENIRLYHRHGYSWTAVGTKP
jgi:SAM-dependent methyltransferase